MGGGCAAPRLSSDSIYREIGGLGLPLTPERGFLNQISQLWDFGVTLAMKFLELLSTFDQLYILHLSDLEKSAAFWNSPSTAWKPHPSPGLGSHIRLHTPRRKSRLCLVFEIF